MYVLILKTTEEGECLLGVFKTKKKLQDYVAEEGEWDMGIKIYKLEPVNYEVVASTQKLKFSGD